MKVIVWNKNKCKNQYCNSLSLLPLWSPPKKVLQLKTRVYLKVLTALLQVKLVFFLLWLLKIMCNLYHFLVLIIRAAWVTWWVVYSGRVDIKRVLECSTSTQKSHRSWYITEKISIWRCQTEVVIWVLQWIVRTVKKYLLNPKVLRLLIVVIRFLKLHIRFPHTTNAIKKVCISCQTGFVLFESLLGKSVLLGWYFKPAFVIVDCLGVFFKGFKVGGCFKLQIF